MTGEFRIELLDQGWLVPSEADLDLCSHGHLRVTIGGVEVVGTRNNYGISESALALLRTLATDHTPEAPVAERIIFHGCGTMLMMGCPIGADFAVRHRGGLVTISNVVRFDTTNEDHAVRFANLAVELPATEYRSEVMGFAVKARELFAGTTKRFTNDFDTNQYQEFWMEFEQILANSKRIA